MHIPVGLDDAGADGALSGSRSSQHENDVWLGGHRVESAFSRQTRGGTLQTGFGTGKGRSGNGSENHVLATTTGDLDDN